MNPRDLETKRPSSYFIPDICLALAAVHWMVKDESMRYK